MRVLSNWSSLVRLVKSLASKLRPWSEWRLSGQPKRVIQWSTRALAVVGADWSGSATASCHLVKWSPIRRMYWFPAEGAPKNQYRPLTMENWASMPVDYEYVSSWECCVSGIQSNWQQTLQRRVYDRANRNGSVLFPKSSWRLDGHLSDQSEENGGCFGLMQMGRLVERSFDQFWDFHAFGKECLDGLLAHRKDSTSSIHREGDPVSGNREDEIACVPKSVLDWYQYRLSVLSVNRLMEFDHQTWCVRAEVSG